MNWLVRIRKDVYRWTGFALGLFVIWGVGRFVGINGDTLGRALRHEHVGTFAGACGIFLVNLYLNSMAYAQLLRAAGAQVPTDVVVTAYGSSVLAKYMPAPLLQIVGRSLLLVRAGAPAATVVRTSLMEQVISAGLCGFLGYWLLWPAQRIVLVIAAGVGAVMLALLSKSVRLKKLITGLSFSLIRTIAAVGLYLTALAVFVFGYWVLIENAVTISFFEFCGALLLGTFAGLVAVFVPGGLGVREAVTSGLALGSTPELLAGLLVARVALFVAEFVANAVCLAILVWRRRIE